MFLVFLVWPLTVPSFSPSGSNIGVNYTLEKRGDTDTWTKFFIEGNELKQNYTFDYEVKISLCFNIINYAYLAG